MAVADPLAVAADARATDWTSDVAQQRYLKDFVFSLRPHATWIDAGARMGVGPRLARRLSLGLVIGPRTTRRLARCAAAGTGRRSRRSHRLNAGHRRTTSARAGGPPGDDGPGSSEPPGAPRRRAVYSFALSTCPTCGAPLVWHGGYLLCPTRGCPRWGKPC